MSQMKENASFGPFGWFVAAMAALLVLVIVSQVTDAPTCHKIPGCATTQQYLGRGIGGFAN